MPLLKEETLPISRQQLAALRARLVHPGDFEIVDVDDHRHLFLRAEHDPPEPVLDLEAALEYVPNWVALRLAGLYLLSDRDGLHVPAYHALPILAARQRLDESLARRARDRLNAQSGHETLRVPGDPRNLERLVVRVPCPRIVELAESDLAALAEALGPSLDAGAFRNVRLALLVAGDDFLRFRANDFLEDLAARWAPRRPPPGPSTTRAVPEPGPRRVTEVEPLFELEVEVSATPEPQALEARLAAAADRFEHRLTEAHFTVLRTTYHDGVDYALAAERTVGWPRKVAVKTFPLFTRAEADLMLREARALGCDQLYVITPAPDPDAQRVVVTSKVKVLRPEEVGHLAL